VSLVTTTSLLSFFRRYFFNRPGVIEIEAVAELLHHGEGGFHPGAMRYAKLPNIEFLKRADGLLDLFF
jgi:hypothetical protein